MIISICLILSIQLILVWRLGKEIIKLYKKALRPLYIKYSYVRKEKGVNYMSLVYEITCAAPVDLDVVERRLVVTINGEVVSTDVYSATSVNLGEKSFLDGDNVKLSLVDVDDVGNASEPAVMEFVAADTLPPSTPSLGVTLVREE
jgi:hypothetical protein